MNDKGLKVLGLGLTIGGALIGIASSIVGEKKTENLISDKVAKEVAKQLNKGE